MKFGLLPEDLQRETFNRMDSLTMSMFFCISKEYSLWRPIYKKKISIISKAAAEGHLDILKWARENNCSLNEDVCLNAARGGHLKVLKWARKNGCPWYKYVSTVAAGGGYLEVLKWARDNGCIWDEDACGWRKALYLFTCGKRRTSRSIKMGKKKWLSLG